jgi:hypothetical protein
MKKTLFSYKVGCKLIPLEKFKQVIGHVETLSTHPITVELDEGTLYFDESVPESDEERAARGAVYRDKIISVIEWHQDAIRALEEKLK